MLHGTVTPYRYPHLEEDFAQEGNAHRSRRIKVCLKKATRDGEIALFILTNLPKSVVGAKLVADMYRKRWSIETMF